jgi:hypothetical protein
MNPTVLPSSTTPASSSTALLLRAQQLWRSSPGLGVLAVVSLLLIVASILGLLFDPRTNAIIATPAWSKTFKFSVSTLLYSAGLLGMLELLSNNLRARRWATLAASAVGLILSSELVLIVIQAVRAQPMHFNYNTPFDLLLWNIMSISIFLLLMVFIFLMVVIWRNLNTSPLITWSLRLGLLLTLLGLLQGFSMVAPTNLQLAALQANQTVTMQGAHTVGSTSLTPDAGPGLPLLGWSSSHGDLRIGHFIGLHALQLIPLLGLWLSRRRKLAERAKFWLLAIGTLFYGGLMALVTWQALRGQSIIAPDAFTLTVLAALLGAVVLASVAVMATNRPRA